MAHKLTHQDIDKRIEDRLAAPRGVQQPAMPGVPGGSPVLENLKQRAMARLRGRVPR